MGKTVLIVPQKEMIEMAHRVLPEFPGAVDEVLCPSSTATAVDVARKCIADGADIIIARGLQAFYIEENCKVSVVTMRMTAQDVAILVDKAKKLCNVPHPKIALLSSANMLPDLSAFNDLFDIDLQIYECPRSNKIGTAAVEALKQKPDALIGGVVDVEIGRNSGIPSVYVSCSEDSVREAIRSSIVVRTAIELRKQSDAHFESLFTGAFNGFILFDNNGISQRCNPGAELLLGKPEKDIASKSIQTLFPRLDYKKFTESVSTASVSTEFITVKRQNFVIVLKPIVADNATNGIVLSFRKIDKGFDHWEETQVKLRTSFNFTALSQVFKQSIQTAKLFCLTSQPVLIYAESGLEASMFARCIHSNTDCTKKGPFISADCSCWNGCEQQSDSLFGYGPKSTSDFALGILGLAGEGTLFLDNFDTLAPSVQARLFHAIRYHNLIYPENAASVSINLRLIARTRLSILKLAQENRIIPDLYHILAPMSFEIPPLRKTPEDLQRLAEEFFNRSCNKYGRYLTLSPEAKIQLGTYFWEGNLTQLKMFMERLVISTQEQVIGADFIKTLMQKIYPPSMEAEQEYLEAHSSKEEFAILEALRRNDGDRIASAEELGISKTTLWRWMKKYGITTKY